MMNRKIFSKIGLSCLIYLIVVLLAPIVSDILFDHLFHDSSANEILITIGTFCLMYLVGVPLFFLCIRKLPKIVPVKSHQKIVEICRGICTCYTLMMIGNILGILVLRLARLGDLYISGESEAMKLVAEGNILFNTIVLGILAPVAEELVFRKLIIDRIRIYGDKIAIVLSALIFGLFHGNPIQSIYTFFFGLALAYYYIKTGSLLLVIIYHSISNSISSILSIALKDYVYAYVAIIVIICIIGVVTILSEAVTKKIALNSGEIIIPRNKIVMTVVMNWGMIVYIFACCGLIYMFAD